MTLDDLIKKMDPAMHAQMRRAIEIGKWPDGGNLSQDEREQLMMAVIAWEQLHVPPEDRIGYMHGKDGCTPDWLTVDPNQEMTIKWDH